MITADEAAELLDNPECEECDGAGWFPGHGPPIDCRACLGTGSALDAAAERLARTVIAQAAEIERLSRIAQDSQR